MIGCNLKNISKATLDVIKNTEVIAVNQDSLGLQAQIVAKNGNALVFAKPVEIANGKIRAVALFNGENSAQTLRVLFKDIQLSEKAQVRDLWTHTDLGEFTAYYETSVPAHGTAMLRVEGNYAIDKTRYQGEDAFINDFSAISSGDFARVEAAGNATASGGYKLTKLGHSPTNRAEFRNVYVSKGGTYTFKVFYYSPENRKLQVNVNGTVYLMQNLNTGNIHTRGEADIKIKLNQGNNVICLNSDDSHTWAPDIDKFELIAPGSSPEPDHFDR
jgi:hypothetical protein